MTEREIVKKIDGDKSSHTDFSDWQDSDSEVLSSCFDKGFIRWNGGKLVVTDLGRRSCGSNRS